MRSGAFERLLCQNAIVETFPCVLGSVGVRDDCMAWGMEEALHMIVNAATARSDRKKSTKRGVSHSRTENYSHEDERGSTPGSKIFRGVPLLSIIHAGGACPTVGG